MFSNNIEIGRQIYKWLGLTSFLVGLALLVASIGYFSLSVFSRSELIRLEYQGNESKLNSKTNKNIHPIYWTNPRWADMSYIPDNTNVELIKGFIPIDVSTLPSSVGTAPIPSKLSIPSIGLNSPIKELEVVQVNKASAWETPKHIAGHIPSTSRPGEKGILYLFGHLHSPVKGEGSVFRDLIRIPELLESGREIYVVVENQYKVSFLYKINQTTVVHEDAFVLDDSDKSMITLVACVPKYVYDHRLLVSGDLIAIRQ